MPSPATANEQLAFNLNELMSGAQLPTAPPAAAAARIAVLTSLHGENSYLSEQLNTLQHYVDAWQPRLSPDYTSVYNTLRQLHDFPHDVLQPKEDLVYQQLMARDAEDAEEFAVIRNQHDYIYALSNKLLQQLSDISHGEKPARRDRLRPQLQRFIDAFRQHIDAEENEIYPSAEKQLLDCDWYALQTGIGYLESENTNSAPTATETAAQSSASKAVPVHQPLAQHRANRTERVVDSISMLPLLGAYSLAETIGNFNECSQQLTKLGIKQTTAGLNASLDDIMACRDTSGGVAELPGNLLRTALNNVSHSWRQARIIVRRNWRQDASEPSRTRLLRDVLRGEHEQPLRLEAR